MTAGIFANEYETGIGATICHFDDLHAQDTQVVRHELENKIRSGTRIFIIDAAQMDGIEASAISLIFTLLKLLSSVGGSVRIAGANSHVTKILNLTQITRYVPIYRSIEDALVNTGRNHLPPA
jgi:anti-anti-sigma factor